MLDGPQRRKPMLSPGSSGAMATSGPKRRRVYEVERRDLHTEPGERSEVVPVEAPSWPLWKESQCVLRPDIDGADVATSLLTRVQPRQLKCLCGSVYGSRSVAVRCCIEHARASALQELQRVTPVGGALACGEWLPHGVACPSCGTLSGGWLCGGRSSKWGPAATESSRGRRTGPDGGRPLAASTRSACVAGQVRRTEHGPSELAVVERRLDDHCCSEAVVHAIPARFTLRDKFGHVAPKCVHGKCACLRCHTGGGSLRRCAGYVRADACSPRL